MLEIIAVNTNINNLYISTLYPKNLTRVSLSLIDVIINPNLLFMSE